MNFVLIGFVIYLCLISLIGFLTFRNNKNNSDFFVAGRKLNPRMVAFSERASGASAWLMSLATEERDGRLNRQRVKSLRWNLNAYNI